MGIVGQKGCMRWWLHWGCGGKEVYEVLLALGL